jgi:hypothetical protein
MPWLVREEEVADPKDALLFVHVPRCGGTSLSKLFQIAKRSKEGRSVYHKIGLTYFFYRYRLLETAKYACSTFMNKCSTINIAHACACVATRG